MKMFSVSPEGQLVPLSFRIVSAATGKDLVIPFSYKFRFHKNVEKKCIDITVVSPPGKHLAIFEDYGMKTDVRIMTEKLAEIIKTTPGYQGFTMGEISEEPDYYEDRFPKEASPICEETQGVKKVMDLLHADTPFPDRPETAGGAFDPGEEVTGVAGGPPTSGGGGLPPVTAPTPGPRQTA